MIEEFKGRCDVALALHCCGNATDWAILQAQSAQAVYVAIPCCIGECCLGLNAPWPLSVLIHLATSSSYHVFGYCPQWSLDANGPFETRLSLVMSRYCFYRAISGSLDE